MRFKASSKFVAAVVACSVMGAPVGAYDWPNPEEVVKLPTELVEIPSLDNPAFVAEVERIEAAIRTEPTNRDNLEERANVARRYFNALQAEGFPAPNIALIITNAMQAFSAATDEQLNLFVRGSFDTCFKVLRKLHKIREEMGPNALGWIEMDAPDVMTVRDYVTIKAVYHVGKIPVRKGAKFRFGPNWQNDMSPLQFTRDKLPGYSTVHSSNSSAEFAAGMELWHSIFGAVTPPGAPRPIVTLIEGELMAGDTVTFVLGDTTGGGPGLLLQNATTDAFNLRFEIDPEDAGRSWIPIAEPRFDVRGTTPSHIRVVAPTTVRPGESFSVRASVEDKYFNRAIDGPIELTLLLDGKRVGTTRHIASDPAVFHFEGIKLPRGRKGPVVYEVRDDSGALRGRSNPVNAIGPDDPHVYWGDLHSHEGYTDGTGTAEWVMNYAKNVAFLDFFSLTGHDLMMSELHQRDVQRATEKYHTPNSFVTFKAYEWTQLYPFGGHHNVYYSDPTARVIPMYEARNIAELYRLQREVNDPTKVLIIPHCHEPGDWNFNDAQMERLVEIYSIHGRFEWFARRYLEQGYHMGLIASGDDHTGHPGNQPVRRSQRGGVVAVLADELTRQGIFDGLMARRVYGTTNARMYLKTEVEGARMGTEVEVERPEVPSLRVNGFVSGTAPIARVTAVLNGRDAEERNFLAPDLGETSSANSAIRLMIANTTFPGGDKNEVRIPLPRETWWGRIALGKTPLTAITPLGLDSPGDTFAQTGERRVDFACTVTGDQDGVLMELERWNREDTLKVDIFTAERGPMRSVSWPLPLWGENATEPVATVKIPLADLEKRPTRHSFSDRAAVVAERVGGNLSPYQEFSFTLTEGVRVDDENYVYVRVQQIDDEIAWSSPVWVTWKK